MGNAEKVVRELDMAGLPTSNVVFRGDDHDIVVTGPINLIKFLNKQKLRTKFTGLPALERLSFELVQNGGGKLDVKYDASGNVTDAQKKQLYALKTQIMDTLDVVKGVVKRAAKPKPHDLLREATVKDLQQVLSRLSSRTIEVVRSSDLEGIAFGNFAFTAIEHITAHFNEHKKFPRADRIDIQDWAQKARESQPASVDPQLPSALAVTSALMKKPSGFGLAALARLFKIVPRNRLKPILADLIEDGKVRVVGREFRAIIPKEIVVLPGADPLKARLIKERILQTRNSVVFESTSNQHAKPFRFSLEKSTFFAIVKAIADTARGMKMPFSLKDVRSNMGKKAPAETWMYRAMVILKKMRLVKPTLARGRYTYTGPANPVEQVVKHLGNVQK